MTSFDRRLPTGLLEQFVALADEGSVAGAALSLGLSASAVSRSLRRLESETGLVLFRRTGGRLVPTTVAGELLTAARIATADLQLVKSAARQAADGELGVTRVAAPPGMTIWPLPQIIAATLAGRPAARIDIAEVRSASAAVSLVESGAAEVGLVPRLPVPPSLRGFTVGWHRMVLLCPLGWAVPAPLPAGRGRRLSWLGTFPLIEGRSETSAAEALATLRAEGAQPRTVIREAPVAALLALVATGVGAALAGRHVVPADGYPGVRVVDLAPMATYPITLMHRPGELSPLAAQLRAQAGLLQLRSQDARSNP